jgi:integrase/recombinase XerD
VEHLVCERHLARNTQASYRATLALLLPLVSQEVKHPIEQLAIESLAPKVVKRFLGYLEQQCGCSIATRNIRLSALQALARFIALYSPKHIAWRSEMCTVPFKKPRSPT